MHSELNQKFYLILTGDGSNSVIISEINENLQDKLLQSKHKDYPYSISSSATGQDSKDNQSIYYLFKKLYKVNNLYTN